VLDLIPINFEMLYEFPSQKIDKREKNVLKNEAELLILFIRDLVLKCNEKKDKIILLDMSMPELSNRTNVEMIRQKLIAIENLYLSNPIDEKDMLLGRIELLLNKLEKAFINSEMGSKAKVESQLNFNFARSDNINNASTDKLRKYSEDLEKIYVNFVQ